MHAAGLLGPGLSVVVGQGDWPSGVDGTPGTAFTTPSLLLHDAPGPDAGHCSAPAGTLTLASSAAAVDVQPCWATESTPAAQTAAVWLIAWTARPGIRLDDGPAARATTLI